MFASLSASETSTPYSNNSNGLPNWPYKLSASIFSSFLVGVCGVIPLLFITVETEKNLDKKSGRKALTRWLSYAVGSLLGDVFIHLLPAASASELHLTDGFRSYGYLVIFGAFLFCSIEKLSAVRGHAEKSVTSKAKYPNNHMNSSSLRKSSVTKSKTIHIEGYLNLVANVVDNFTHGVAIGGSYLLSLRHGLLTTLCILIHEVPHEMSDFVILLRNGFDRWQAAKAQLATASSCIVGAIFTLTVDAAVAGWSNRWILPFTSGGFLYISLVTLAPDIIKENCPKESLIQLGLIFLGLSTMGLLSVCLD